MSERLNILPDPRFAALKTELTEHLAQVARAVESGNFASLFDALMRQVLHRGFAEAQAQEGTVWLVDSAGQSLVPAYNTGPHAHRFVGTFRQPLDAGLICMVFASEQPFVENEVFKNARQSKRLDELLGVQTYALIAVPFYFLGGCRGVISCVQLKSPGTQASDPPGFSPAHLEVVQETAAVLTRLIDLRLLGEAVGWLSE